jgi:hypothetical protein
MAAPRTAEDKRAVQGNENRPKKSEAENIAAVSCRVFEPKHSRLETRWRFISAAPGTNGTRRGPENAFGNETNQLVT